MQFKDYYEVLGVKSDAKDADIKSAYRRLARKFHPDVSKETGAEEKFKAVNEAYEALKDSSRRQAYDQLRAGGYRAGDDFRGPPPNWQGRGAISNPTPPLATKTSAILRVAVWAHGRRRHAQRARTASRARRAGADRDPAGNRLSRGSERVSLRDAGGGERTLDIRIPAGVQAGQQIRLAGQGYPGANGGHAGDLLLEIRFRDHDRYALDGRNVLVTLPIAPWEAALGATVPVPTLGGTVELRIPAGSDSGRKLRLRGRGWPARRPVIRSSQWKCACRKRKPLGRKRSTRKWRTNSISIRGPNLCDRP